MRIRKLHAVEILVFCNLVKEYGGTVVKNKDKLEISAWWDAYGGIHEIRAQYICLGHLFEKYKRSRRIEVYSMTNWIYMKTIQRGEIESLHGVYT